MKTKAAEMRELADKHNDKVGTEEHLNKSALNLYPQYLSMIEDAAKKGKWGRCIDLISLPMDMPEEEKRPAQERLLRLVRILKELLNKDGFSVKLKDDLIDGNRFHYWLEITW